VIDSRHLLRLARRPAPIIQNADNLGRKDGFSLANIGIGHIKIALDIAAAPNQFDFLNHFNTSFNLFKRLRIRAISV